MSYVVYTNDVHACRQPDLAVQSNTTFGSCHSISLKNVRNCSLDLSDGQKPSIKWKIPVINAHEIAGQNTSLLDKWSRNMYSSPSVSRTRNDYLIEVHTLVYLQTYDEHQQHVTNASEARVPNH